MVYGKYKYIEIDIDMLVVLPQVRKEKNAKINELIESIKQNGLINPIDIAVMDLEHFKKHIAFINSLWKTNIDYRSFPSIDNLYYVVIAGHTRYHAIREIDREQNSTSKVHAKVHDAKTSEEILSIQLDENIHKEPRIEERAIAIIECYFSGLQSGKWTKKEEFVKENKQKFSRNILNDALAFINLPTKIQTFILNGNTYYQVGVELGRIASLLTDYVKHGLGENYTEEELTKAIYYEYTIILNAVQKKRSVKKAVDCIKNYKQFFEDQLLKSKEEIEQETLAWFNEGTQNQSLEYLRELKAQVKSLKIELSNSSISNMSEFLSFVTELTEIDTEEEKKVLDGVSRTYKQTILKMQ